ncbi:MAG: crossover junction endodeoxyribonuclease RuvC [Armatimonadetes bacterium]|nr:crossover junction endodeoxyribonuclease RuvC [Armatimonadota bacterium]MDW8121646.1 crossover junction endodeoxyribonuclease RuvC [Armatimonadota bacterium]
MIAVKTILALDPGTHRLGFALIRKTRRGWKMLRMGTLKFSLKDSVPLRLKGIYEEVSRIVQRFQPDHMVVESLHIRPYGQRATLIVAQCVGTLLLLSAQQGIPVFSYPMTTVRKTLTGNGSQPKSGLHRFVRAYLPDTVSLMDADADAWDALALAVCHSLVLEDQIIDQE